MKTIYEVIHHASSYLKKKEIERHKRIAEWIVAHVLNKERLDLYLDLERKISKNEHLKIQRLLYKAGKRMPIEYLLGFVDFYGLSLRVNPSVLIPRVETEILFDYFAKQNSKNNLKNHVLLDLCTGSGCLGIAAKKTFPDLDVYISDLSVSALKVARKNAELNKVELTVLRGSLLDPFKRKRADYILCNPPYLSAEEYENAENPFEPKMALVGGNSGFTFFKKLSKELPLYLKSGGKVYFEIGYRQKEELIKIFNQPCWVKKEFISDWSGHDRFFFLEIE